MAASNFAAAAVSSSSQVKGGGREGLHLAQGLQQAQIIEDRVQPGQAPPPGDRRVKERTPDVGGIAQPHRGSQQPEPQGRFQGIGQGYGQVKTPSQAPENPPFFPVGGVGDDLRHPGQPQEEGGYPPGRQYRDLRLGKEAS